MTVVSDRPTDQSSTPLLAPGTGVPPRIVQGGMGVGISGWRLARAVSQTGQLGVVSGTALDVVLARRLQDGDPDGHMRRALAAFPVPAIADWITEVYFVEGGIAPDALYRPVPRHTLSSAQRLVELTVAAAFCEVWLAKEGHEGLVGLNVLRKIELPMPATLYGALLAGVDAVLVGAGNPAEIPELVRGLAAERDVSIDVRVMGARSSDGFGRMPFSPRAVVQRQGPQLRVPAVLAIVASTELAQGLAADPQTRPDGFVVEGHVAGGHNAPPRGPLKLDEFGSPVYGERDEVDLDAILALGLPVWLAGGYGTPERVQEAMARGAAGVQVGTAFAFSDEGGFAGHLKDRVRSGAADGSLRVRSDARCSPTGFPFQVVELPETVADPQVAADRKAVCDLGVLRTAYLGADGTVDFRCPAEPVGAYLRKGGREINRVGRVCLCNALLASAGMPQRRPGGAVEPGLVTSGSDVAPVAELVRRGGDGGYAAADVVDYLLGH